MIKALQNVARAKIQVLVRITLIEVCVAVLFQHYHIRQNAFFIKFKKFKQLLFETIQQNTNFIA